MDSLVNILLLNLCHFHFIEMGTSGGRTIFGWRFRRQYSNGKKYIYTFFFQFNPLV